MDAKQLLSQLGLIASAPNGLDELRQLVMGLALAGDIVEDNADLPEDFGARVELARQRYFNGQRNSAKRFRPGQPLIREFRIPSGWRWMRVAEVCDLQTGATPSTRRPEYFGGDIRWLVSGDGGVS
jgi:type I restriction enzyme S subunit